MKLIDFSGLFEDSLLKRQEKETLQHLQTIAAVSYEIHFITVEFTVLRLQYSNRLVKPSRMALLCSCSLTIKQGNNLSNNLITK